MAKVLLVGDDVELVKMLGEYLEQDGFNMFVVNDSASGLKETLTGIT